jgi:hypothetical protein
MIPDSAYQSHDPGRLPRQANATIHTERNPHDKMYGDAEKFIDPSFSQ